MNNLKKIKAYLLLSMMLPTLSSCSNNNIDDNLRKNYKIIQSYELDNYASDGYYLVKLDNNSYNIVGHFDTLEEAKEYLDSLDLSDDSIKKFVFIEATTLIIFGFMYFSKKNVQEKINENEKKKVLR